MAKNSGNEPSENTRRAAECPICDDHCVIMARDDQPWNLWCPCCHGHDYERLWPDDYDVEAWEERATEVEWHL